MDEQLTIDVLESELTDNQESIETEEQPEGEELETESTETEGKAEGETNGNFYKPEEFRELLKKSPLHMDRSRVPQEYLEVYDIAAETARAMQADYTRKTMELSEKRKQLSPEEQLYREFIQNPLKLKKDVETAISNLELQEVEAMAMADYQKVRELRTQMAKIREVFSQTEERYANDKSRLDNANNVHMVFQAEIVKDFPDYFSGRVENLTNYLANEGVDTRVQALFADPMILDHLLKAHGITDIDGITAAKQIVKAINKAYERANAAVSADKKEKKRPPHTGTSLASSKGMSEGGGEFTYADALKIVRS